MTPACSNSSVVADACRWRLPDCSKKSYLQRRRMVNTIPPDTEKAMAAGRLERPGGVYLK